MIQSFQKDKGHGDEFVIKCQICDRVYAKLTVPKGSMAEWEFPSPLVPCHANGITVTTPEGDPFTRVLNLMEGRGSGEEFAFSVDGMDGMIHRVAIQRSRR